MEGISKRAVASSKLLRFLIGPENREFTIHAALVAHHSPVLGAMVNSNLKESIDYIAKWDDIDEGVVVSFW
ncbi:unnamed protein product [Clonostachys rosea f. rosea IK726]|uniref:BTB domain-containing protein n=2 Tax=Bionectria ochroleuca TaxID=29856 RepID=A0A0B7KL31_BIOOC|nr:unnamed protein product [Clonostachys rosea f. rosea IK726]